MPIMYDPTLGRYQLFYYSDNGEQITGAQYLRLQRERLNLSQAEYAAYIGHPISNIRAWERETLPLSFTAEATLLSLDPSLAIRNRDFYTQHIPRLPTRWGVRALRRLLWATVDDLSRTLGVSTATMYSWETGRREPSRRAFELMKQLLDDLPDNPYQSRYDRWNRYL